MAWLERERKGSVMNSDELAANDLLDRWMTMEDVYATKKWPMERTMEMLEANLTQTDNIVMFWVGQYIGRAKILGFNTPLGKQALGKALMTLWSFTIADILLWGDLPEGGYPSGEIVESP